MTAIVQPTIRRQVPAARVLRRRHRWLLLLAFEVLVFGAAQAVFQPVRRPGITVEQTISPNHVVT